MWDLLRKLAFALLALPEKGETEPDSLYQWRIKVAFTIIVIGGVQMGFAIFAFGYLSFVGWGGFAMATDVQQLIRQGHDTRVSQLERVIKDDRTLQCNAIMEGNRPSMDYAYFQLQKDIDSYVVETTRLPRIPDCGELIPTAAANAVSAPTPAPSMNTAPKPSITPPAVILTR